MIYLNTLGRVELLDEDGHTIQSVLHQPKRLALLVYLAVEPGASRQRHELLPLFWPGSDEERALNSLRVTLSRLRTSLGSEVLVGSGQQDVGLNPEAVVCDAARFREAVEAGELETAAELYQGPLLPGFFLDQCPGFERWVTRWRGELRRQALRVFRTLAREALDAEDPRAAASYARNALGVKPLDEEAFRLRMRALAAGGNRAGALEEAEAFVRSMKEELDGEPSSATREVIEGLRRESPAAVSDEGESQVSEDSSEDGAVEAGDTEARVRRPGILAAVAFIILLMAGFLLHDRTSAPAEAGPTVAFDEGEEALLEGRFEEASNRFFAATRIDPSFALAHQRLALAARWASLPDAQAEGLQGAERLRNRLEPAQRLVLDGLKAENERDVVGAREHYRRAAEADPDSWLAWHQIGEVDFHWGPTLGSPVADAREPFRRAQERAPDPGNFPAEIHLARLDARAGDPGSFAERTRRLREWGVTPSQELELRALEVVMDDDPEAVTAFKEGSVFLPRLAELLPEVFSSARSLENAVALAGMLTESTQEAAQRANAFHWTAWGQAARGRLDAAFRALDRAAALEPHRTAELRAALLGLPFLEPGVAPLRSALDGLMEHRGDVRVGPGPAHLTSPAIYGPRRVFLEQLLEARIREARGGPPDPGWLGGLTVAFDTLPQTPQDEQFVERYRGVLTARALMTDDQPGTALIHLGPGAIRPDGSWPFLLSYPQALERWTRAEALRLSGRDREALRWYAGIPDPRGYDLPYRPMAHLRRGQIYARLGEADTARAQFRRVLEFLEAPQGEMVEVRRVAERSLRELPR